MWGKRYVQDEVDVVAEEGAHDERKGAPSKGEQKHVHGRDFVLHPRPISK